MTAVTWTVTGTPIGPLLLAATGRGLAHVVFHAGGTVSRRALDRLAARFGGTPAEGGPETGPPVLADAAGQLRAYFAGARTAFDLELDWSLSSGFSLRVLRELASGVPYGTVVSYQDLADRVGEPGAARAVGVAMGSNPLPVVVPCHRVVEQNGGIGGFGGGLPTKRALLELEGVLPQPLF
ncbi:methylated-DNA--[protein]-cysteine S-methyltransferase [Streptomyces sp. F63]|uniref:methylated-DNA--[protein]-cysteine S-methyltransferase n=1 Tax=Streptomyces sp. F63 TaxID=2824887 RepID=UPI001B35EA66|nr:methylated-DNA--[protein]-cysteine S-methyltransferase [Streptomyces sp. F63]MBQ0987068.1 methylated-DNA--[protein]-cysteine S-methyltransferase [Streptomyces sp. F63]